MFNNGMIWLVVSVFFSISLKASENNLFSFTSAEINEQLSQKTVRQVYQDSTGYVWLVTQEGVSRYDGYQLLNFTHDPRKPYSLSSDNVRAVIEDKKKRLWLATDGGGLNLFNSAKQTYSAWQEADNSPAQPTSNRQQTLYLDSQNFIWLGYRDGNFSRFNPDNMVFEHFNTRKLLPQLNKDAAVTSIAEDANAIWLATNGNGLLRLDKSSQQLSRFYTGSSNTLFSDRLTQVFIDVQQRLWLASYDAGVSVLEPGSDTFTTWQHHENRPDSLASNLVHTIYQDQKKRIWLGTEAGLSLWNSQNGFKTFITKDGLSDNKVLSILQDPSGLMWVGTYSGVTKGIEVPFEQIDTGLASNVVLGFAETLSSKGERSIWVASYDGLTRLNGNGEVQQVINTQSEPALIDPRVMTVLGEHNILWFGTRGGGLGRLNVDTQHINYFVHDPKKPKSLSFNGVASIFSDDDGNLWVGTFGGGLDFLPSGKHEFIHFTLHDTEQKSINSDRVLALYPVFDDKLVVGTVSGVNLLDLNTWDITSFEHQSNNPDSLSAPMAWAFYQDPSDNLWVGTQGGGLNRWSATDIRRLNNHFARYDILNGLPSSHIYSIQADEKNNLWLSSTSGLTRFNPASGKVRHFDTSQGLKDSEFNFGAGFTDSLGYMYFGGNSGLVRFHPENVKDAKVVPPVVLVRIKKLNEKVGTDLVYQDQRDIVLKYQEHFISFEFTALDFNDPKLSEYRYKLEGLNPNWIELGHSRVATFTDLSAGKYVLKVQASNHQGMWNAEAMSLTIEILPPPWKTVWAYSLYVLVLVLILLNFIRGYRLKRLRVCEHLNELEEKVDERTTDLILANEKLEQISFTDPLTGLKNRRYLTQNLTNDVGLILAKHQEHAVLKLSAPAQDADLIFFIMDLDLFKQVNDKYGHSSGDAVLVEVKVILEKVFRDTDYLLRWGGEEFLIVARFVDRSSAAVLAERLRCSIEEHPFKMEQNIALSITCSIGFSVFPLLSNQPTSLSWERTIDIADMCLYAAKKSSRNAWVGLVDSSCVEDDVFVAIVDKTEHLIQSGHLRLASSITDTSKILWR